MNEPEEIPDPSGEPIAVEATELEPSSRSKILPAIRITLGAGVVGAVILTTMTPSLAKGAPSSVRLNWMERQTKIEKTIRQQEATEQSNPQPGVNHQ